MKNKTENDEFLSDLNKALFSSKKRPKDNSGKELEKLLKEIELLTRPLPAKKKKKTESGGDCLKTKEFTIRNRHSKISIWDT